MTDAGRQQAILLDIDDTIADTQAEIIKYVNQYLDEPFDSSLITREFREHKRGASASGDIVMYSKLVRKWLDSPDHVSECTPLDGALESVAQLADSGFDIHVASSRQENLHDVMTKWLMKHGFMDYVTRVHLRHSSVPGAAFKVEAARTSNAVAAFDDTLDVCEALAEFGVDVFMVSQPWNQVATQLNRISRHAGISDAIESFLARVN